MGITYIEGQVRNRAGKEEVVRFLVDSGAVYSLLPESVWRSLGLKSARKLTFVLADGTAIERSVSEVFIVLPHGEGHTPVILGERDDQALLGVITLEILGLVFNPFNRTLQPARMPLCGTTKHENMSRQGECSIRRGWVSEPRIEAYLLLGMMR